MQHRESGKIALGGVFAAVAVLIMCLGGLIPVATFVCPMMCILILQMVRMRCGMRFGWAWYGVVSVLSALLGPDKEAAAVFIFLGFYPLVKPKIEQLLLKWLWKAAVFNACILSMYGVLIFVFGMNELAEEYKEVGKWLTVAMLLMGNVTFFLLDKVLSKGQKRYGK